MEQLNEEVNDKWTNEPLVIANTNVWKKFINNGWFTV